MFSIEESLEMGAVVVDVINRPQLTVHDDLPVHTYRSVVNVEYRRG